MTEQLHFHFSLSCIGEGNGNPLQCSCLDNPRDREAWGAAVYVVTQSQTQLKWQQQQQQQQQINLLLTFLPICFIICLLYHLSAVYISVCHSWFFWTIWKHVTYIMTLFLINTSVFSYIITAQLSISLISIWFWYNIIFNIIYFPYSYMRYFIF